MKDFIAAHWLKALVIFTIVRKLAELKDPLAGLFYGSLAVLSLGLVIFVHELGHALFFLWRGVGINVFSLGFGKPIYSFILGETKVALGWIPAGGYVEVVTSDSRSQYTEECLDKMKESYPKRYDMLFDTTRHFENTSNIDQFWGVVGGPLFSYLFGLLLVFGLFAISGVPDQINPFQHRIAVSEISEDSDAYRSGVRKGDIIHSMSKVSLQSFPDVKIPAKVEAVSTTIYRDGSSFVVLEVPREDIEKGSEPDSLQVEGITAKLSPSVRVKKRILVCFILSLAINTGVFVLGMISPLLLGWSVFAKFEHQVVTEGGGGPVGILAIFSSAGSSSYLSLLLIIGIISSAIGGLNSFPGSFGINKSYPLLDGGKLAQILAVSIFGKDTKVFLWWSRIVSPIMILLIVIVLADLVIAIFR